MYGFMTSAEESSMGDPEEDIVAPKLRIFLTETDRNKNTTITRYTNLGGSEGLYITKFYNIRKVLCENGTETDSRGLTPPVGAARWGPCHWWVWPTRARFPHLFRLITFHM